MSISYPLIICLVWPVLCVLLSHNTRTTSWIDPRCLDKPQKPLEESEDDGTCLSVNVCAKSSVS